MTERKRERGVQVSKSNSHPSTNTHLGQKCQSKMGGGRSAGEECGRVLRAGV